MTELNKELSKLSSIQTFNQRYPEVASLALLRKLVFCSESNGFNLVVVRVGRKVLIHEDKFFDWLEKRNGSATHGPEANTQKPVKLR